MSRPPKFLKIIILLSVCGFGFYAVTYLQLFSGIRVENNYPILSDWQDFTKMNKLHEIAADTFIYSAYLDTRTLEPVVKIVGMGPRFVKNETLPKCFLVYTEPKSDLRLLVTVPVMLRKDIITDYHKKPIAAAVFVCKLIGYYNVSRIHPIKLVLRDVGSKNQTINLPVKTLHLEDAKKADMAVCVRPFFGPFKDTRKVAEFVAFYRVMGANHFTFYDFQTRDNVVMYLKELSARYKNSSAKVTIDVLPWNCPEKLNVWQFGQIAAVQDCLYRHTSRFKYVAPIDLDEYIVPKLEQSVVKMLKSLDTPKIGAFMFRNSIFCNKLPKTKSKNELRVVQSLTRAKRIHPPFDRSKVILKPFFVVESAIHYARNFTRKNYRHFMVEPKMATIHHLKYCKINPVRDETILRFKGVLNSSIELHLLKEMFG